MTTPFPIDNLPYGVISTAFNPTPRCATALDDTAIDLSAIEKDGHFKSVAGFETEIFSQVTRRANNNETANLYSQRSTPSLRSPSPPTARLGLS